MRLELSTIRMSTLCHLLPQPPSHPYHPHCPRIALPLQADARAEDAMQLEFDPAASAKRNLQGYMGFRRLQMATTDADAAMGLDFDAAGTAKRNLQGYMGF